MKTKILAAFLLLAMLCSCKTPHDLPEPEYIGVYERGSHLKIQSTLDEELEGELIAIDGQNLVLLLKPKKECIVFPMDQVKKFQLFIAKPADYAWTIPVYALATASHGWYAGITLPVNLLVTSAVAWGAYTSYRLTNKQIDIESLGMYARFPQGIPPGLELSGIE